MIDGYQQARLFEQQSDERAPGEQLAALAEQARTCRACPLWEIGTQTVFGSGPATARLMFVGEAPGQQEDRQGRPFVGPAGKLFDQALEQAGLEREAVYVTNVVKHRPWVRTGGRPKNRAPKQSEINACRPWLQGELDLVRPEIVVCLGATAARELLGRNFKLTQQRGQWQSGPGGTAALATLHPAYILIQPPESYDAIQQALFDDLRRVAERYQALPTRGGPG
jgi:DNA polymerase